MADKNDSSTKRESQSGDGETLQALEEANEKGYIGTRADDTPHDHYTVEGVTSGKPTPETERDNGEA